jgi:hypothetical protein
MTRGGSVRIPLPILSQRRAAVAPTEADQLGAHLGRRRRPLSGLVDHAERLGPNPAVLSTCFFCSALAAGHDGEELRPYRNGSDAGRPPRIQLRVSRVLYIYETRGVRQGRHPDVDSL